MLEADRLALVVCVAALSVAVGSALVYVLFG